MVYYGTHNEFLLFQSVEHRWSAVISVFILPLLLFCGDAEHKSFCFIYFFFTLRK